MLTYFILFHVACSFQGIVYRGNGHFFFFSFFTKTWFNQTPVSIFAWLSVSLRLVQNRRPYVFGFFRHVYIVFLNYLVTPRVTRVRHVFCRLPTVLIYHTRIVQQKSRWLRGSNIGKCARRFQIGSHYDIRVLRATRFSTVNVCNDEIENRRNRNILGTPKNYLNRMVHRFIRNATK